MLSVETAAVTVTSPVAGLADAVPPPSAASAVLN
jgi:hypothetical protein